MIVDALVIKIRDNGSRVKSFGALVATDVNHDGYYEILGMEIGNSETEESWSKFSKCYLAKMSNPLYKDILDAHPKSIQNDVKSILKLQILILQKNYLKIL